MIALKKKLREVEMERDILKKAALIFGRGDTAATFPAENNDFRHRRASPNLLKEAFVSGPKAVLVGDITYLPLANGSGAIWPAGRTR